MESLRVERRDHCGLIACAIKDFGLMDRLDSRLVPDEQEVMTPGEAVAGMLLHGLGVPHRPLSFTPQFFANKPRDLLWHDGVEAAMYNRFQLGRTRDDVQASGGDLLCSDLALAVGTRARRDQRFTHLDTTRFALRGDEVPASDAPAMTLTQGYAQDHRPDLPQAVWALRVSQAGGGPLVRKRWDGNASETQRFQERAEALLATLQASPVPRELGADATRSTEDQAATLAQLGLLTRIPGPLTLVTQVIPKRCMGHGAPQGGDDPLSTYRVGPLRHGPTVVGGVVAGGPGAGCSQRQQGLSARIRTHRPTTCGTCQPPATPRLRLRRRPWPRWPHRGDLIRGHPLL